MERDREREDRVDRREPHERSAGVRPPPQPPREPLNEGAGVRPAPKREEKPRPKDD